MEKINLKLAKETDLNFITFLMFNEPGIRDIFYNKYKRLLYADHPFIIQSNNVDIGFIYSTNEGLDNFEFLDIGIKQEYRGHNYAEIATLEFIKIYTQNINNKNYLISEIKKKNVSAIKTMEKIGNFLFELNDLNFYLANKEKYVQLIKTNHYNNLYEYEKNKTNRLIKK